MKTNKNKIIVSTLALAMGAALAGSVSGTVAWFQYSTRAQATFIGTTAHCSEALEIQAVAKGGAAVEANWKTELTSSDVATAYGATSAKLAPITAGAIEEEDDLPTDFYANPLYQHFELDTWDKAVAANYAQFDLLFRVKDINGASSVSTLAKNVYLTDLDIVSLGTAGTSDVNADSDTENDNDLYKAVRVHIAGDETLLFANDGTTTNEKVTTSVSSKLDLNNDGKLDAPEAYEWETATTAQAYGSAGNQVAYNVGKFDFTDDSDPTILSTAEGDGLVGATTDSAILRVTVTIWIEGWQVLSSNPTGNAANGGSATDYEKLWEPSTYIGQKFGVGFRFAVPAHDSTAE